MSDSGYREDALYVNEGTETTDIVEFVERRIKNPYTDEHGNICWNFSTHEIVEEGLHLDHKRSDRFTIPYPVTGVWPVMFQLLPEQIRNAEVLIWKAGPEAYHAYRQYYRELEDERQAQFRDSMERYLADQGIVGDR